MIQSFENTSSRRVSPRLCNDARTKFLIFGDIEEDDNFVGDMQGSSSILPGTELLKDITDTLIDTRGNIKTQCVDFDVALLDTHRRLMEAQPTERIEALRLLDMSPNRLVTAIRMALDDGLDGQYLVCLCKVHPALAKNFMMERLVQSWTSLGLPRHGTIMRTVFDNIERQCFGPVNKVPLDAGIFINTDAISTPFLPSERVPFVPNTVVTLPVDTLAARLVFKNKLGGLMEGVLRPPSDDGPGLVVAGGMTTKLLTGKDIQGSDVDLWIVGAKSTAELQGMAMKAAKTVVENYFRMENNREIQLKLSSHVLTLMFPSDPLPPVQIVMRGYRTTAQLLMSYDYGSVRSAFDGTKFWATGSWHISRALTACFVDPTRATTIGRALKQQERGYTVCIPIDKASDAWKDACSFIETSNAHTALRVLRVDGCMPVGLIAFRRRQDLEAETTKDLKTYTTPHALRSMMYAIKGPVFTSECMNRTSASAALEELFETVDEDDVVDDMMVDPCRRLVADNGMGYYVMPMAKLTDLVVVD